MGKTEIQSRHKLGKYFEEKTLLSNRSTGSGRPRKNIKSKMLSVDSVKKCREFVPIWCREFVGISSESTSRGANILQRSRVETEGERG
jgi:hypothetical protein